MSCEECGSMNHTNDVYPRYLLNDGGYGPPPSQPYQRWNLQINQDNSPTHPSDYSSLRDLVFSQAKINEQIHVKLLHHDRILGDLHARLDEFSLALGNQLNFNERLENQLSTLISKFSHNEKVNAITTRGGKITHDPPYPKATNKKVVIEVPAEEEDPVVPKKKVR